MTNRTVQSRAAVEMLLVLDMSRAALDMNQALDPCFLLVLAYLVAVRMDFYLIEMIDSNLNFIDLRLIFNNEQN